MSLKITKNIDAKDIYEHAFFTNKPKVYLRALRVRTNNMQLKSNSSFVDNFCLMNQKCHYCKEVINKEDFDYFSSYWKPTIWIPSHKKCKLEYQKDHIISCQEIDADCNDCKHFVRGKMTTKDIFEGDCLKYNKPTKANVNFCSMKNCFEHRKK